MSYTPEAVVLSGYKISPEAWTHAWGKYEENPSYPCEIEDMFIDADPMTGEGPLFFGKIIHSVDENCYPVEIDNLIPHFDDINTITIWFVELFQDYYSIHPEEQKPKYSKYLFCRWM